MKQSAAVDPSLPLNDTLEKRHARIAGNLPPFTIPDALKSLLHIQAFLLSQSWNSITNGFLETKQAQDAIAFSLMALSHSFNGAIAQDRTPNEVDEQLEQDVKRHSSAGSKGAKIIQRAIDESADKAHALASFRRCLSLLEKVPDKYVGWGAETTEPRQKQLTSALEIISWLLTYVIGGELRSSTDYWSELSRIFPPSIYQQASGSKQSLAALRKKRQRGGRGCHFPKSLTNIGIP